MLGVVLSGQVVLLLEQGLYPVVDGADLGGDGVLQTEEGGLQLLVGLLGLIHSPGQPEEHDDQHGCPQSGQYPGPDLSGGSGLLPGGQILLHDLLDHGQLGVGELGGGLGGLRGSVLHPQQPAHGDGEDLAQGDELFHLGDGGVRLPLVDGLAGYPQLFSQGLLGQAQFLAFLADSLAQCHTGHLPSSSTLREKPGKGHQPGA